MVFPRVVASPCIWFLFFMLLSCGPQYVQDPNVNVLVTSQYEDEPIVIHLPANSKPQLDCKNKNELECAAALYWDSEKFIAVAKKLIREKLYLSASLEYLQALTRLSEAKIRINKIKKLSGDNLKLKKKVEKRIQLCERKVFLLHRKRK